MILDNFRSFTDENGKTINVNLRFNPFCKYTVLGCGLAIGGVLLATLGGWASGGRDVLDTIDDGCNQMSE